MAAAELTIVPPGRRRQAAADLARWVVAVAFVHAVGYVVTLVVASTSMGVILAEPVGMVILMLVATQLLRRRGEGWRDLGLRRPASVRQIAGLVLGGLIAVLGANALLVLFVFRALGIAAPNVGAFGALFANPWLYAAMLVLTWTTVAFGEEMQFRGFIFSRLEILFGKARSGTVAAWLGQGLLFGLLHAYQGVSGVLVTASIGLILGGIYLASRRNLAPSIILHGLIDTMSLTALFSVGPQAFR